MTLWAVQVSYVVQAQIRHSSAAVILLLLDSFVVRPMVVRSIPVWNTMSMDNRHAVNTLTHKPEHRPFRFKLHEHERGCALLLYVRKSRTTGCVCVWFTDGTNWLETWNAGVEHDEYTKTREIGRSAVWSPHSSPASLRALVFQKSHQSVSMIGITLRSFFSSL